MDDNLFHSGATTNKLLSAILREEENNGRLLAELLRQGVKNTKILTQQTKFLQQIASALVPGPEAKLVLTLGAAVPQ